MDDLIARFRDLDELDVPDLRREARRRLPTAGFGAPPEPPVHPRQRLVAAVVAIAVFAAAVAAVFGLRALRDPSPDTTPQPADAWSWAGEGWTELPAPPEWRDGATFLWTGSQLISWGGRDLDGEIVDDGYSFDPSSSSWSTIPSAPSAITDQHGVWTGDEALFFGTGEASTQTTVLAFDPGAGSWTTMAAAPFAPRWGGAWAWTGSDLIVAGGGDQGGAETTQAWVFDLERNDWRRLPEMPIAVNLASATWTGTEFVVVGSEIDRGNHASTRTAVAAAYDPTVDVWRRLPDPPVSAQTADVDQVGEHLVAWEGYSPAAAEFLHDEDRWRSIDTGALEGHECYAEGVAVGGTLVSWTCGDPAVLHTSTLAWTRVDPPLPPGPRGITFSVGSVFPAGDVAVVAQIETITSGGETGIGEAEAPRHLWVWRPSSEPAPEPEPTAGDVENLVGIFVAEWEPGWEAYLSTRATQAVIDLMREGGAGVPSFEQGAVRNWRTEHASALEDGAFEVPLDVIRDHEVVASLVFTVGPGTTADGRSGQLVIVDVRATG